MPTTALIVAAGAGLRMRRPSPKAFLDLAGRPLVEHCMAAFDAHPGIGRVIVMAPDRMLERARLIASRYRKVSEVAPGGERRQDTVRLGLERLDGAGGGAAAGKDDIVLVHDAARPLVDHRLITGVLEAAARTGAAIPGIVPADTVRQEAAGGGPGGARLAAGALDRRRLILVQTPQGFRLGLLREAYRRGGDIEVTDDAALVERLGHPIEIVTGSSRNLKVTTPEDLDLAAALLGAGRAGCAP